MQVRWRFWTSAPQAGQKPLSGASGLAATVLPLILALFIKVSLSALATLASWLVGLGLSVCLILSYGTGFVCS